jgi:dihydrofolate synthase / folylpolyglutamate synthase
LQSQFHNWQNVVEKEYGVEKARLGLERLRPYVAPVIQQIEARKPVIVTVAGTNGKGETIAFMAQALKQQGISYCLWTSPHLLSVAERFQNELGTISEEDFIRIATQVHADYQSVRGQISFYEFFFTVFARWVNEARPQVILLEVGLGGRLDCVNYFSADLVLIPSISRDHQEYLGNRYEQILVEKLGVLRAHSQLITSFSLQYLIQKTQHYSQALGNKYLNIIPDKNDPFFIMNRNLAWAGLAHLVQQGRLLLNLSQLPAKQDVLAGRSEQIQMGEMTFELYGSHNVDGLRKLVQYLCRNPYNIQRNCILLSFSDRAEHDLHSMVKSLAPLIAKGMSVYFTSFEHYRASSKMKDLSQLVEGIYYIEDWKAHFAKCSHHKQHWVIAGSYYFISHFKFHFHS